MAQKKTQLRSDNTIPLVKDVLNALRDIHPEFPLQYALCLCEIWLDEGLSVTALAERMNLSLSTVSRIVGALSTHRQSGEPYGLVEVRFAPQSRRQKEVYLSAQGQKTIQNISKHVEASLHKL